MSHNLHRNQRFLIHRRALPVLSDGAVVQGATPAVELTAPTFPADSGIVLTSASDASDASSAVVDAADSVASTTLLTTTMTTTTAPASPTATDGSFATSIIQDEPSVTSAPMATTTAAAASVFSAGPVLIAASQDATGGLSTAARGGLIAGAVAIGFMLIAFVIYRGCRRRRARAALTASITSDSSSSLDGMTEKPRNVLFLSPPSKAKTTRDFKSSFENYTATSPGLTTPAGWATFSNTSIPDTIHTGVRALPPLPQPQPSRWSPSTYGDSRIPISPTTPSTPPRSPPPSTPSTPPKAVPMTINPFDDRHISPSTPSAPGSPSARGNLIKRKTPPMVPEIRMSVSDSEAVEGDMGFIGTAFRPNYSMGTAAPVEAAEEMLESPKSGSKIATATATPKVLRFYNQGDISGHE